MALYRLPVEGGATLELRQASSHERWRGSTQQLGEALQVLRGCGQQHLVPHAAQASQAKPIEPEDALHVCKAHFDFFALPARLLEGFRVGQGADAITHILVEVAGDLAHDRRRALRLQ